MSDEIRVHALDTTHICPFCGRRFSTETFTINEIRAHHDSCQSKPQKFTPKTVPLVMYDKAGERVVIGEAHVNEDGEIDAKIASEWGERLFDSTRVKEFSIYSPMMDDEPTLRPQIDWTKYKHDRLNSMEGFY